MLGLLMDLSMSLSFVGAGKASIANVARERLLAGMGANMGGEMVGAGEGARAHVALERLVARVDTQVPRELVRAREAPRAAHYGARVRTLVYRRLARSVRVFARLQWQQNLTLSST